MYLGCLSTHRCIYMHVCTMTYVCLGAICDRWMTVASACVMAVWTGFWQSDWR